MDGIGLVLDGIERDEADALQLARRPIRCALRDAVVVGTEQVGCAPGITDETLFAVAADTAYQNGRKYSDEQHARIEHHKALTRVITALVKDDSEPFRQFSDNNSVRRWLTDTVFGLTYSNAPGG